MTMTTSPGTEPADLEFFQRSGVAADAANVARIRDDFSHWLCGRFDLDPGRANDIVLAVNEALANVAEFAYRLAPTPGAVTVVSEHDPAASVLRVSIIDQGVWRDTDPDSRPRTRGRGIPLMHALSDHVEIARSDAGTSVVLRFDNVAMSRDALLN